MRGATQWAAVAAGAETEGGQRARSAPAPGPSWHRRVEERRAPAARAAAARCHAVPWRRGAARTKAAAAAGGGGGGGAGRRAGTQMAASAAAAAAGGGGRVAAEAARPSPRTERAPGHAGTGGRAGRGQWVSERRSRASAVLGTGRRQAAAGLGAAAAAAVEERVEAVEQRRLLEERRRCRARRRLRRLLALGGRGRPDQLRGGGDGLEEEAVGAAALRHEHEAALAGRGRQGAVDARAAVLGGCYAGRGGLIISLQQRADVVRQPRRVVEAAAARAPAQQHLARSG